MNKAFARVVFLVNCGAQNKDKKCYKNRLWLKGHARGSGCLDWRGNDFLIRFEANDRLLSATLNAKIYIS